MAEPLLLANLQGKGRQEQGQCEAQGTLAAAEVEAVHACFRAQRITPHLPVPLFLFSQLDFIFLQRGFHTGEDNLTLL